MTIFIALFFFLFVDDTAHASLIVSDHVKVRIISSGALMDNSPLKLGVHFEIDPEWHIYWKNPGDSGAAPKFTLEGGVIEHVEWPYPKRIPISDLTNIGYEKESVIFLTVDAYKPELKLKLEWLVCKVDCTPGFGGIDLTRENIRADERLFNRFYSNVPIASDSWDGEFYSVDTQSFNFNLSNRRPNGLDAYRSIEVFPEDGKNFLSSLPKYFVRKNALEVGIPLSKNANLEEMQPRFIVVAEMLQGEVETFALDLTDRTDTERSFFLGLVFAFLGGLILNIMPCVFPVLVLKGYRFLQLKDPKSAKKSAWLYAAGILLSFLIIGGMVYFLKVAGRSVGWGFQMQNPVFIGCLIVIFLLMALSFLDVVKLEKVIPYQVQNIGNYKIFSGDFATGVLAVVVASPCTAPFMGSALGLTLVLPAFQGLLIFLFLGVGLASPTVALAHWPWLVNRIPKSGRWILVFKKCMAVPLLLTAGWLSWVLSQQVSTDQDAHSSAWVRFDPEVLESKWLETNVFIDFTAAWCITCQVNKRGVLDTEEIQDLFRKHGVHLVRADWTNYDPSITSALAGFQRNSVPVYVYYRKGSSQHVLLPELLTKNHIYNLLNGE